MRTLLKLASAAAFAAVSILFAWSVWVRTSDPPPRVTLAAPIAAAPQIPDSASVGTGTTPPARATSAAAAASTSAHELARLLALGTPAAAYDAYALLATCAMATQRQQLALALPVAEDTQQLRDVLTAENRKDAAACASLTPTQVASRLALLERAVAAHIPGAATAMLREGPWGDHSALHQRPDDPLVAAWRERVLEALKASARHGDENAMFSLSQVFEGDSVLGVADVQQSVLYWVATVETRKARGTHRMPARAEQLALASVAKGLSQKQRAAAVAAGRKFAAECCITTKGTR